MSGRDRVEVRRPGPGSALPWALLILLHPLAVTAYFLNFEIKPGWDLYEVAFLLEWIVAAGWAFRMRPWIRGQLEGTALPREPAGLKPDVQGFAVELAEPWVGRATPITVLLGTVLATLGTLLYLLLGLATADVTPVLGGLGLLVMAAVYGVAQLVVMAVVALSRASQSRRRSRVRVSLAGRVLRVGDHSLVLDGTQRLELHPASARLIVATDAGRVAIPGDMASLKWLAGILADLATEGDEGEVPAALRRVRERLDPRGVPSGPPRTGVSEGG